MSKQTVPYSSLDTPAVLVDLDQFEANIQEVINLAADAGIQLRPHVKLHENATMAKMQIEAGTSGVEVGNVVQAERMAEEGLDDILIAHPFYGEHKFRTLERLINKPGLKLSVVVDMVEQAQAISQIGQAAGVKVPVFIKIDTGVNRYGVLPGAPALDLARKLRELPGVELVGIYAHESGAVPTDEGVEKAALEVGSATAETVRMLRKEGFTIKDVTVGASPTVRATCRYMKEGKLTDITEIHPGACFVGDIMYMMSHGNTRQTCALTVLTTVVSTSHACHVVIDAGYKTFGCDSLVQYRDNPDFFWEGRPSFGSVEGRQDLWLGRLGAESGVLSYKESTGRKLCLGERLEIVPNNATLVINLHDQVYGVRNGVIEKVIPVTGRGAGS